MLLTAPLLCGKKMICQAGSSWSTQKDLPKQPLKRGKEMKVIHTSPGTSYVEVITETLKLMHVVQEVKFFN